MEWNSDNSFKEENIENHPKKKHLKEKTKRNNLGTVPEGSCSFSEAFSVSLVPSGCMTPSAGLLVKSIMALQKKK